MVDHLDLHKPLSQEDFTSLVVAAAETPLMEVPGVEAAQKPNQQLLELQTQVAAVPVDLVAAALLVVMADLVLSSSHIPLQHNK
jgi:hypothetical protein